MLKWFKKQTPSIPDTWLTFEIGQVVCRWTRPDGNQRVYLIARHDGDFSCGSEYFSEDENEMCWVPQGSAGSVFGSEEIGVKEIHGRFPWAREVLRENKLDN